MEKVDEAIAEAIRKGFVRQKEDGRYVLTPLGEHYASALRAVKGSRS